MHSSISYGTNGDRFVSLDSYWQINLSLYYIENATETYKAIEVLSMPSYLMHTHTHKQTYAQTNESLEFN